MVKDSYQLIRFLPRSFYHGNQSIKGVIYEVESLMRSWSIRAVRIAKWWCTKLGFFKLYLQPQAHANCYKTTPMLITLENVRYPKIFLSMLKKQKGAIESLEVRSFILPRCLWKVWIHWVNKDSIRICFSGVQNLSLFLRINDTDVTDILIGETQNIHCSRIFIP